jgi:hypothetical protein
VCGTGTRMITTLAGKRHILENGLDALDLYITKLYFTLYLFMD